VSPLLTDYYQLTMLQAYFDEGLQGEASFEFFVRRLPPGRHFLLAAGLEQALEYLQGLRFSEEDIDWLAQQGFLHRFLASLQQLKFTGDVDAMPEGTVFFADEPILRVTAPLPQAQLVETRLINLLQYPTLVASKAARARLVAPKSLLVDFGLRRSHGAEAGLLSARASYVARRKRSEGKATWPGRKQVYRQTDAQGYLSSDLLTLAHESAAGAPLLAPVMRAGRRLGPAPDLLAVRRHAAAELARLPLALRGLGPAPAYPVQVSGSLHRLADQVDAEVAARMGRLPTLLPL
jgi:nicotinic acid phosphoribosyltransferase